MKAMLLAAGLGTRLYPLTAQRPKCMVRVAGKPVLQWNIEWLRSQGCLDLIVNLHHCPEAVSQYFGDGNAYGVRLVYSYEPELMGTAGALWAARRFLSTEQFWVIYADNLLNCSLERMERRHGARDATLTMGLFWREDVGTSGMVEVDGQGRITRFTEKPAADEVVSHWVNAGLFLCQRAIMQYIPPNQTCDFGHDILPAMLSAGAPMYGHTLDLGESLYWIDTPADLVRTEAMLRQDSVPGP